MAWRYVGGGPTRVSPTGGAASCVMQLTCYPPSEGVPRGSACFCKRLDSSTCAELVMILEMGVMMTTIIMAGRTSATFGAQLGTK